MILKVGSNKPFEKKVYLASPTMHGEEIEFVKEAYETNWMSTIGANINEVEKIAAQKAQTKYAVALCNCTSALHLCCKFAGEKLYGRPKVGEGSLAGKKVFCSDMTFDATVNPVVYEGGEPVFIDTDETTWNMDPIALKKAFEIYPDVRLVVYVELYGFPSNVKEIKKICEEHGALLIEDAAEAMGATVEGQACGSFGDYSAISYNGNKIITGSSGGCLLTNDLEVANKARKWSTQAREDAPWYQHEEIGYNYRMSNVIAGVIRGQYLHLEEHIKQKQRIYELYQESLKDLPIKMNPITKGTIPNYWLSALIINEEAMCRQVRDDSKALYIPERGKTCPTEILNAIASINAEGRPIWKPMHMQPMYRKNDCIGRSGTIRCSTNAYILSGVKDIGADIFNRGCCLPSDNKMTQAQQYRIIEIIRRCFD
ncbi:MAG: aminotransferase DegT [Clostridiales bacterium]|nr:aminotransferase DegT [Clostridiales bacterium]